MRRDTRFAGTMACGVVLAALLVAARSAEPPSKKGVEDTKPARDSKQVDFASPELAKLDVFVGPWNVTENHINAKGEVAATAKGTEEIAWTLDNHVLRRMYITGEETGPLFRASGMLTWNEAEKKYCGVWFDNVSTAGPTVLKGTWEDETRTMVFNAEAMTREGKPMRYKVVERFIDDETRVATTYRLGGEVVKVLEVRYQRATPCPSKLMLVPGQ